MDLVMFSAWDQACCCSGGTVPGRSGLGPRQALPLWELTHTRCMCMGFLGSGAANTCTDSGWVLPKGASYVLGNAASGSEYYQQLFGNGGWDGEVELEPKPGSRPAQIPLALSCSEAKCLGSALLRHFPHVADGCRGLWEEEETSQLHQGAVVSSPVRKDRSHNIVSTTSAFPSAAQLSALLPQLWELVEGRGGMGCGKAERARCF